MILAASGCVILRDMAWLRYEREFPSTPVMIQEYHNPHGEVEKDLVDILQLAQGPLLAAVTVLGRFATVEWRVLLRIPHP